MKRTGTGVTTTTSGAGGGGLFNAVPIITKGRGRGRRQQMSTCNYFLGIDTVSDKLAADFEEGVGGNQPPRPKSLGSSVIQ